MLPATSGAPSLGGGHCSPGTPPAPGTPGTAPGTVPGTSPPRAPAPPAPGGQKSVQCLVLGVQEAGEKTMSAWHGSGGCGMRPCHFASPSQPWRPLAGDPPCPWSPGPGGQQGLGVDRAGPLTVLGSFSCSGCLGCSYEERRRETLRPLPPPQPGRIPAPCP